MQRARRITYPTGIETHVDDHVLNLWQASAVAIVEQKTALGTQGVLAEVALGTPGCFPAFDNLVTLTVRAADGDERHGPFLPMRSYEDKAQCDIHLSPSLLFEHLRLLGCLVLFYTSRVVCKGRLTMEEIIFSLKHYWRFVDCEALELKALSEGVDEQAA